MSVYHSDWPVIAFESLTSTNTYLKDYWREHHHHSIIRAIQQTQGRGRLNRPWTSEKGGLWFSVLFRENLLSPHLYQMLLGVGAIEVIRAHYPSANALLKWPNDLYAKGKKLAGILQENIYSPDLIACIVGMGINVNNSIPDDLSGTAISLAQIACQPIDEEALFHSLIERWTMMSCETCAQKLYQAWYRYSWIKPGMQIELQEPASNQRCFGEVVEIDPEKMRIKTIHGAYKCVRAGDVRITDIHG